jgi:Ca2+-binding RTX toxin-like protein
MTTVYANDPIFGGFNIGDVTTALQNAINTPGVDKVIVPYMGNPWLISSTIHLKSNQEIDFAPDVVVRAKPGSFANNTDPLFQALAINNIKLVGEGIGVHQATLAMNPTDFSATNPDEYAHIIAIEGTDNYTISGLTLTGAGGDGIFIDAGTYASVTPIPNPLPYSDHGLIDNVTSTNNRRNGLSVISAQNLTVTNSKFINSSGTATGAGIDFEPDYSTDRLSNITLKNVDVSGNKGNGLSFSLSNLDNSSIPTSIDINGATINGNGASGIGVGEYYTDLQPNSNAASSTPNGVINISNVTIAGTKGTIFDFNAAISIQALSGDRSDPNNLKVNFNQVAISNTGSNSQITNPIFVLGFGGVNDRNQIGNLAFNNVTVADNFDRPIINIQLNQLGSFNNITGNITGINPYGVTSSITSTAARNNFTLTVANSPVVGNSGNDTFNPGPGAIAIDGGAGNDTLNINNGADTNAIKITYTTVSNGTITGGANDGMTFQNIEGFNITTGAGSDTIDLSAATASVTVNSGAGNDTISGGTGNDTISGGAGIDIISGGAGNDVFGFNNPTDGIDKIMDFGNGSDLIGISRSGFGGDLVFGMNNSSVGGTLLSSQFTLGTSATNTNQRFIYNQQSGALFYDRDGSGSSSAQVRIAQLVGNPTLTAASFVVF